MSDSDVLNGGASGSLFHYTDVSAVKSIIDTRKIRFTDYRYLNDAKEFYDGVEYIRLQLEKLESSSLAESEFVITSREWVREFFKSDTVDGDSPNEMYVCSFSRSADQLSQWRSYGGYCIEFDRSRIDSVVKVDDCCYSLESKVLHSRSVVEECIKKTAHGMEFFSGESMSFEILKYYTSMIREVLMFKDEAFREENESRCVMVDDNGALEVKYRVRGELLVPYVELDISLEDIKAIHIGPIKNQSLALKSMRSYLQRAKYELDPLGLDGVDIKLVSSTAPYRSL